jgi:hypothetical protein
MSFGIVLGLSAGIWAVVAGIVFWLFWVLGD